MTASSLFIQSFSLISPSEEMNKRVRMHKAAELRKRTQALNGVDFLKPLDFYLGILNQNNELTISYMSPQKKEQLLFDLKNASLFLLAQQSYEQQHQKTENQGEYDLQLNQCCQLIDRLQGTKSDPNEVAHSSAVTKPLIETMRRFNKKRLYWVWGSALIKTMMDLMPADLFYVQNAKDTMQLPDPTTGFISWSLYYFRFGLNLSLCLKHIIPHQGMSEEERNEPLGQRIAIQWDLRKFTLLNDLVWATVNLLCYFWLYGKGIAGVWGDFITVGLLMFDVSLAAWEFLEQKSVYGQEMMALHNALTDLEQKKASLVKESPAYKELVWQQHTLERVLKKYDKEWRYQNTTLIASLIYAVTLTLAFLLATLPFFPATLPLLPMTVAGTILCFALTVISNGIKNGVEIYKAQQTLIETKQDAAEKLNELDGLQTDAEKKDLFLELKLLMIEQDYQEQQKGAYTLLLVQSIALQLLVPTLIFSSLVFLPPGLGLVVLGAGLALMSQANQYVHRKAQCTRKELDAFDEGGYDQFIKTPEGYYKSGPTLFRQKNKSPEAPPEAFCMVM